MHSFAEFTGPDHEQEDDITLLVVECEPQPVQAPKQPVLEFDIPSQPGNERQAAAKVLECLTTSGLSPARLQRLETAVAEATMNAMEHGNHYQADLPVHVQVFQNPDQVVVRILDHGGDKEIPQAVVPDLDAKLAGLQSPRGWGLFLIQNMVDVMKVHGDSEHHVIEMVLHTKEG
jgi:anti-sigma regulatory factor (Ser/Thr protein kinase)